MKQLLHKTVLAAAIVAASGAFASASPFPAWNHKAGDPLGRMRKVDNRQRRMPQEISGRARVAAPDFTTPSTDGFQYLYGPDGSQWYATSTYDVELKELEGGFTTERLIKGYSFTIYDSKFNEIGTIHDVVDFKEGETRCAQVMLDVTVTKKFFNYDNNYEVMVSLSMNKADYTVDTRTKVYSLGAAKDGEYDTPLTVIPGYPVDAVNAAIDKWSEDFFITFLTEIQPDPDGDYPEYIDFLAGYKQVMTTYRKAGMNGEATVLHTHEIPMLNLPGDQMSSPMMLCKNVDGKFTAIYAQYEKSLFIDPSGMGGNEDLTPDNNLVIDVYQLPASYSKELEHLSTTRIATLQNDEDDNVLYTFYGIGNLLYDRDVDYEHFSTDGRPSFIVSVDEYLISDDDNYNSSYYVYDADGNRTNTIARNTFNYVALSDLPGHEPQMMFIHTLDDMTFEFVDVYSCRQVMEIDQMYKDFTLSTSVDRVATADGYRYAIAFGNGIVDDNDDLFAPVGWFDMNGEMIRTDMIPMGQGVELVQPYISGDALSPYVFNTDGKIEYMLLVKRRVDGNDAGLREELVISTVEDGAIHTFLPDENKGVISTVYLIGGNDPQLILAYANDNRCIADAYALPFTCFAGGNGTEKDPYLIATAGDLQLMHRNPNAHYRLSADIDCGGISVARTDDFTGSLDGGGYTISNLALYGADNNALFGMSQEATFKNLNFYNCSMAPEGFGESALLASTAINCRFDNVHVRRLNVNSGNFTGTYGSIAGRVWMNSVISECEVTGADINIPASENAGGIAGEIRTGSVLRSCAFMGSMTTDNTLGGIVGTTSTGDETITNCHVDANLKAKHTVGGIVGFLDRSKVSQNYVEGTIEVTEPSKWTKALSAGGIAGELQGDWEGNANVPVTKNLVGVSSIIFPELDITPDYPHQLATVHRVVGRTSYNAEPEILDYDQDDKPIYKDEVVYEQGILENLVLSDLACIDADFDGKSMEGTSIDKYEIDTDMLEEKLGFAYGTKADAPWNLMAWYDYDPSLYYENMLYIPCQKLTVEKGETFDIELVLLTRMPMTEDEVLGAFMCEYNEDLLELTGDMTFDGKKMTIGMHAIEKGRARFTASLMSGTASCQIAITENEVGAVEGIGSDSGMLAYSNGRLTAEGCQITVTDISGKTLMSGHDSIDATSLASGVYVATARNAEGVTTAIKFAR